MNNPSMDNACYYLVFCAAAKIIQKFEYNSVTIKERFVGIDLFKEQKNNNLWIERIMEHGLFLFRYKKTRRKVASSKIIVFKWNYLFFKRYLLRYEF